MAPNGRPGGRASAEIAKDFEAQLKHLEEHYNAGRYCVLRLALIPSNVFRAPNTSRIQTIVVTRNGPHLLRTQDGVKLLDAKAIENRDPSCDQIRCRCG